MVSGSCGRGSYIAVGRDGLMSHFKKNLSFMPSFLALIFLTEVLRSHY